MVNGRWSMVICHRWWRFAHSFLKDAAPKAHPKMTTDHRPLTTDHFFTPSEESHQNLTRNVG
jgi:hypothetical protein